MSEWLSYSLSDFLLFSPRTYYRLFELYNQAVWPGHILAIALGAAILVLLRSGAVWQGRAIAAILAACWLWVAWAYLLQRYDTINWAARYFALGFAVQAVLLIGSALTRHLRFEVRRATARFGLGIFLFALVLQPLIGPLAGRDWMQVEIFGVAPDPTAVGTLGIVLAAAGRVRWELLVIPVIWCAISGATLWTMGSPDALIVPGAAVLALLLAGRKTLSGQ
jgi:hypothetical protein